jgi:HSF-type DNA-binding
MMASPNTNNEMKHQNTDLVLDTKNSSFPCVVHRMLSVIETLKHQGSTSELHKVVSWQDHGMAFMVHDKKKFIDTIMPMWFPRLKHASWVRQISLFGFKRIHAEGKDKGALYHESFTRGIPELATTMQKVKRNGNARGSNNPDSSPSWAQTIIPGALASCSGGIRVPSPTQSPLPVVSSHNFPDVVRGRTPPSSFSASCSQQNRRLSVSMPQLPTIYWPMSPDDQRQTQWGNYFPFTDFPSTEASFLVQEDMLSLLKVDMIMDPFPIPQDDDAWDLEPLPL